MSAQSPGVVYDHRLLHWIVQGFSEEHAHLAARAETLLNHTLDLNATAAILKECQSQYQWAEAAERQGLRPAGDGAGPAIDTAPPTGDLGDLLARATTLKGAWDAFRKEDWREQAELYLCAQAVAPAVARDYARACMQLDCKLISPDEMRNEQQAMGEKITTAIRVLAGTNQDCRLAGEDRLHQVCRMNRQLAEWKARHRATVHGLGAHLRQIEINARRGDGPALG